jgi:peroxiredoxin Q/BCP
MPNIGEIAPDFELASDKGERVKLSSFRGKKVILYFYPKAGSSG